MYASDYQFVGDAAYINLEIEALHRRSREMRGQTARHGSPAGELRAFLTALRANARLIRVGAISNPQQSAALPVIC